MAASLVDRVLVHEDNRDPRQPWVLLVDTSGSMLNELESVSEGLTALRSALVGDAVAHAVRRPRLPATKLDPS